MSTVSKLDAKFWHQHAARYPLDPADAADENPFALPPGFEEEKKQQPAAVRRRSVVQWIPDAIERATLFTMYMVMALVVIALWGLFLLAAASVAVRIFGGSA